MVGLRVSTQPRWGGFRPTRRGDLGHREISKGAGILRYFSERASVGKS